MPIPRIALVSSIIVASIICMFVGANVKAEGGGWYSGAEVSGEPIDKLEDKNDCIVRKVKIYSTIESACVYIGKTIEIAKYGAYTYAAKKDEGVFRRIEHKFESIKLVAGTDILFGQDYRGSYLTAYTLFRSGPGALLPKGPDVGRMYQYYLLDKTKGVQLFPDSGYPGELRAILNAVVSPNGRFMFVYVDWFSFIKVDLETLDTVLIGTNASQLYSGSVSSAIAISGDGRYVATSSPMRVYDTLGCGVNLGTNYNTTKGSGGYCSYAEFDQTIRQKFGSAKWTRMNGRFMDNNERLVFDQGSYNIKHRITIGKKPTYLALGDSYTSGEGDVEREGHKSYYLPFTDHGLDMCHISSRSYPFLLRSIWAIRESDVHSVACSGARMVYDYNRPLAGYMGQGGRLKGQNEISRIQQDALDRYIPGRVPQLEFVKKYKPDIITFTGGGNDIGFGEILKYCALSIDTCGYVKGGYGTMHDDLMASIDDQYVHIKSFIKSVKTASPHSKIYAIGYPSFIYNDGLCYLNGGLLNRPERELINEAVDRLNAAIARAAKDMNIKYLSITDALVGGRICEGGKYMTGVVRTILRKDGFNNMFHPNAKGHAKMAYAIEKAKHRVEANTSETTSNLSPVNKQHTLIRERIFDDMLTRDSKATLSLPPGRFAPATKVEVLIHSKPTRIATLITDQTGGASWSGLLPRDISPGVHLITATGRGLDGRPVQVQQFVSVFSSREALDSRDVCDVAGGWHDDRGANVCAHPGPSSGPISSELTVQHKRLVSQWLQNMGVHPVVHSDNRGVFSEGAIHIEAPRLSMGVPSETTGVDDQHDSIWWVFAPYAFGCITFTAIGAFYFRRKRRLCK